MNQVVVHSPDLKPKDPMRVYDSNGNIIEELVSATKLIYDSLGRLIEVADINDADIATYTYDATNKRISKTTFGVTTVFIYDICGNLIGEYTPSGGVVRDYVYLGSKPIALIATPEGIRIGPIGCPSICNINVGAYSNTHNSVGAIHELPLHKSGVLNGLIYFSPLFALAIIRIFL